MLKPIAIALSVAALGLSACAPANAPAPITNQDYGGKYKGSGHGGASGRLVSRGAINCPDGVTSMYRGDLYCFPR